MLSWGFKELSSPLRRPPNFQDPARQQKTPTDQKTSPGEDLRAQERLLKPAILPVTDQSASDRSTNEASQADARENSAGPDDHFVSGELRRRVTIIPRARCRRIKTERIDGRRVENLHTRAHEPVETGNDRHTGLVRVRAAGRPQPDHGAGQESRGDGCVEGADALVAYEGWEEAAGEVGG